MLGVVAVLLRSGFEIGDCLMLDLALAFAAFFRIFLAKSPGAIFGIEATAESRSISTGELVVTGPCL
jgi:hypothetical protein